MSMSYRWRRALPPPPPDGEFDIGLADLLTRHLFGDPGREHVVDRSKLNGALLNHTHVDWLFSVLVSDGTSNATRDSTQHLIEAISEHGAIRLETVR